LVQADFFDVAIVVVAWRAALLPAPLFQTGACCRDRAFATLLATAGRPSRARRITERESGGLW
jgi:hypothetical protein